MNRMFQRQLQIRVENKAFLTTRFGGIVQFTPILRKVSDEY